MKLKVFTEKEDRQLAIRLLTSYLTSDSLREPTLPGKGRWELWDGDNLVNMGEWGEFPFVTSQPINKVDRRFIRE